MMLSCPTVLSKIQARQIVSQRLGLFGDIQNNECHVVTATATAEKTAKATAAATDVAVAVVSAIMADAGTVSVSSRWPAAMASVLALVMSATIFSDVCCFAAMAIAEGLLLCL
jgi:hypothetical protein